MGNKVCDSALAWCQTNKSKLQKINSTLPLKLITQEFIELIKKGESEKALLYIRKHSHLFGEPHLKELQEAMGCLTFYKTIDKFPKYQYLLSDARWKEIIEIFKKESFLITGMSDQSHLEITLKVFLLPIKQKITVGF
mgnify:CR=1 FL=1